MNGTPRSLTPIPGYPHPSAAAWNAGCGCEPCKRHRRRKAKLRAIYGSSKVDATPARDRVNQLAAEGFSRQAIAAAAGISRRTVVAHTLDSRRQLGRRTSNAILGLARADIARKSEPTNLLPAIGAARRLQALMRMGWRMSDLAADRTEYHLINKVRTNPEHRISAQSWLRIAEMYAQREMIPGPHQGNATKAAKYGYAPPLAWDDIDDPTEQPNLTGESAGGRMDLYLSGLSDSAIAREENVTVDAIRVWRKRNGLAANYKTRGRHVA